MERQVSVCSADIHGLFFLHYKLLLSFSSDLDMACCSPYFILMLLQMNIDFFNNLYLCLVSTVGSVPDCRVGGRGFDSCVLK